MVLTSEVRKVKKKVIKILGRGLKIKDGKMEKCKLHGGNDIRKIKACKFLG